jgi:site-specific recombinase XerD
VNRKHDAQTAINFASPDLLDFGPARGDNKGMGDEFTGVLRSFRRHLKAENKAGRTIQIYSRAGDELADWLREDRDRPGSFAEVDHHVLTEFIGALFDRGWAASYVSQTYRALQQLYKWLCETEEEIDYSPFARLKPPTIPESPVPVIPRDWLRKLLATCKTKSFVDRRDEAIIRVLFDCGVRRGECAGIGLDDLDLELDVVVVTGKGRRTRSVPYGAKAGQAVDRYLRVRRKHKFAGLSALWIGEKGPLTGDGIRQMLDRRCDRAGIERLNPHRFRHTSVDMSLEAGMTEGDAMRIYGWKSRQMLDRYGASRADQRAHAAKRRLSPADRV